MRNFYLSIHAVSGPKSIRVTVLDRNNHLRVADSRFTLIYDSSTRRCTAFFETEGPPNNPTVVNTFGDAPELQAPPAPGTTYTLYQALGRIPRAEISACQIERTSQVLFQHHRTSWASYRDRYETVSYECPDMDVDMVHYLVASSDATGARLVYSQYGDVIRAGSAERCAAAVLGALSVALLPALVYMSVKFAALKRKAPPAAAQPAPPN